ncbi:glycosyltransferase family 1 protein [Candidatus Kaiserbacteria bacterium]|nr:glycosyltransferase family 1 protein [Candidatus Kaiserbacteria bacterium]
MKLVIATPLYPPEIGGPATYSKLLEGGLPEKGIQVSLAKFSHVRWLPKGLRHALYYVIVLWHALWADAVLALDPVSVGYPAMLAARTLKKPFFVKIVGDYAWEQGTQRFKINTTLDEFVQIKTKDLPKEVRGLRNLQKKVANSARAVIVPSQYLKQVVTTWGIPPERIHVIYNTVSLGMVGNIPKEVSAISRPLVVSVGRMVPWKEFDGVIDAVKQTVASLVIVGSGSLFGRVAALAKQELGARAYLTGSLSHADTLAVIKYADVFVLNSSYEGFSHTLIEALLLGRAVIVTDAGGNKELVDGRNGLIIPVGATDVLARELNRVLSDQALRSSLESSAGQLSERFSRDIMLKETTQLLNNHV